MSRIENYSRRSFFFQAEDGIRDIGVTGVQTCALPICSGGPGTTTDRSACTSTWSTGAGSRASRARTASEDAGSSADRKSVVQGKSVDLGGRRLIKKNPSRLDVRRLDAPAAGVWRSSQH